MKKSSISKSNLKVKALIAAFLFSFFCAGVSAQSVSNYTFAATSGTFTSLSGATSVTLTTGNADDGYVNALPIGFDFWYMGTRHTTASVSTNGWITLGANITNDVNGNDLSAAGSPRPVIAPLWDDIAFSAASSISYNTTGTAGSRVFTVQFLNARWDYSANANCISFQVKLHEATGRITFVYRTSLETGALVAPSASIGITAAATGSGNFRSLNNFGTAPTVSSTISTNTISAKPANGQTYTFTPPVPTAPGSLSFTAVTISSMSLNWSDLSSNERGFAIYRSTDGVNYTFMNQVAAGVTSSAQSGLSTNTTYYWRVYAVTEGGLSNALSGIQATTCSAPEISTKPTSNIIAHYRFEGNANDETGNNNGTLVNAPTAAADRFGVAGRAYTLNGTSQHVTTANSYSNPTNFTISIWFKTNTTTGGKLMGFGNSQSGLSSSHDRALYMNNAGNLYFGVYYSSATRTINSPLTYNDNNWHLATATLSSTTGMKLFVDGVEVASNASFTTGENTTGYWRIGYDNIGGWPSVPSSYYFKGTIDDVHIYHTALSATDVELLYENPDGASNNGPVCTNSPITLSATTLPGASYSWTGPNGFTSSAQNPTFTFTSAAAGVYAVTVSVPGCASSTTAYTNVVSGPVGASFNTSTTPSCIGGSTGTITVSATGGSTPYTYSINGGAYQSSATFTGLAAGSYTINVKTNVGCISTASVNVSAFAASADDQNAAATDSWIGHMYDGMAFSTYAGQFTEAETFNQTFGGTAVCFNVVANSLTSSIYTESFSVKYRMKSTKRGLYVADLGSDDGSRLTVNGALVYNNWSDQSFGAKNGVLFNLTGSSQLLYEFYENAGGNQVQFQNFVPVLVNTLSTNTTQAICAGSTGTAISGDVFGTLPAGITLSGTGYQWSYSTTPGGARTNIAGATAATYTPSAASAPFNTPGTYYIYRNASVSSANNVSPNPYVATNESNAAVITVTALPAATISYNGTPFCSNAGTASVTRTGTAGGTYSSTAGLTIDAVSGDISLGSSTAGTYTVTYTLSASGGCSTQTATTSITITALPAATISYTGSPYSQNGGTASVTFTGTTGGVYSSTAGLSINSTTGDVTLGTSTQGTYVITYTLAAAGGCAVYTTTANITILAGTKTFTGTGNFSDPARWTDGTLPGVGENLIIDGTCTVDNNAGTNNIAYGTLVIGTATGRSLSWAAGGTNRLNVSNVSAGAGASTLNMTNGGTLVIRGTWSSTNLTFTSGTGTIELQSTITLPAAYATYRNLAINGAGIVVRQGVSTTINGNVVVTAGTFQSNNFGTAVKGNWTNNVSTTAFTAGTATVTFNGTTAQSIGGSFATTFNNLTSANSASTVTLTNNISITGNLSVTVGTLNLGAFTANRATVGGAISVANNTTLRIGGTNTFPANYTTTTLVVASTVEYSGTNQVVSNYTYGNLTLTSSGGAAVKTFPATALAIVGNLTSSLGSGTSVTYTAGSNLTITGNVTIGASTTFNGSSFSHNVSGNWVNSGTFNGNTGTITFAGPGKAVSGAGSQNFNNLTISGSGITFSNASITVSGNLSTISSGNFSQAAGGVLLMTGTTKTISGSGISLDNLTISGSVSTASSFGISGNLFVSGSFSASTGTVTMSGTAKTISGAGALNFAALHVTGSITTASGFTISSAFSVIGSFSSSAGTVTFTDVATLSGVANLFNVTINGTSLQLSSNSTLGIASVLTITAGILDVSSSTPNTVNFNGTGAQTINPVTYCQLGLLNGNTKTAAGNITTTSDILIGTTTTFDPGVYTHSIYGNWINSGTFIPGASTIQFLGAATAYITGATTFNVLTSNTSSSSTELILNDNVSAAIVNMTKGIITTGSDTITITNTRTGPGYIYGHIRRTHSFTTGISYAFEGPDNTVLFSAVSSVSTILVSVTRGALNDFPFGNSISRFYNIQVPSGTYTATLRLHYEDDELNGNSEADMGMWKYDTIQWIPVGKTSNSVINNYLEQTGITNITDRWTCSINPSVVLWNGSVSSDWNTAANWSVYAGSGSAPPSANDVVVLGGLPFTHQPTISTAVNIKNLVFSSTQSVTLSMGSGGSLTSGDVQGVWTSFMAHTIDAGNQSITINGSLLLSDGVAGNTIDLNIGTGTVDIIGSLLQNGGADINFTGGGTLIIRKDFNHVNGSFNAGTGTVEYNGDENQQVAPTDYNNLTLNKSSGIALADSVINISGNLLISSGTLDNETTINVAGNITIGAGATFHNKHIVHIGGNWQNNGTFIANGLEIVFDGSGTQSISASTFNNLIINKPVGSIASLTDNVNINGNLTVQSGTLNIKTFSCDRTVPGGIITLADSATFIVGGNNAPAHFTAGSIANSSTVIADGTGPQMIIGDTYGNMIFRNAGVKTLVTPITVNGTLTIESGSVFDAGSQTLTLNGNWVDNGTFIPSSSTVICSGVSKTLGGNTNFNKLTVTGSYTILNNLTFNGLLNITSLGSLSGGGSIHTTLHGDLINSGVLSTLGTTTFSGNVLQTLSLIDAVSTVALIVNFNGSVSPVLNSTSVPQFGYININNTGGVNPSVGWNILYSLTVGAGASFNGGVSTHNILGSVTNNGTITSNGLLNFIPSGAATVNLGANLTSTGTVNFGGTGVMTLAGTAASFHNILVSNTNAAGITSSTNWNVANDLTVNSGSILNAEARTYTIGGDLTNNGIINSGTSTFLLNGMETQELLSASAFHHLTISKASDSVIFMSPITANGSFNMMAGKANLGSKLLSVPGRALFIGGQVNNGTVTTTGVYSAFGPTTFGAVVNATSDSLYLNGSTFNNTVNIVKNGVANISSSGGNTFNANTNITATGSGFYLLGATTGDVFNGTTVFTNTGSTGLYPAFNSTGNQFNGTTTFTNTGTASVIQISYGNLAVLTINGNVVFNNTSTGIIFGSVGGKTTLTAGRSMSIGSTGFSTGTLHFWGFTQQGNTAQALTLTGTALFRTGAATTFNGNVNFQSPQVVFDQGNIFNGATYIAKTGATQNNSIGGSVFNGNTTLVNSGSGYFVLGYPTGVDIFNGDLTLTSTAAGGIYPAFNTAGHQFNGNIFVNQTSNSNIYFCGGTGTATLAAGKTISVGGTGFTNGILTLAQFRQLGNTSQAMTLTGTATMTIGPASEFNGDINFTAPQVLLNGATYQGTTTITKSGGTANTSIGGNIYNGITTINCTGSGSFDLANASPDIYNNDLTVNNTGTSRLQLGIGSIGNQFNGTTTINHGGFTGSLNTIVARNPGSTATFNGDLYLNCTNTNTGSGIIIGNEGTININGNVFVSSTNGRGVLFSDAGGLTTLGNGFTIKEIAPNAFTAGTLKLSRFIQNGNSAQALALSGTASLQVGPSSEFNGAVNFNAPQLFLHGARYFGSSVLRKTGATDNTSNGGNIFEGPSTISNNGSGFLRLGNVAADDFNSDATFVQTGSGLLQPSYGTNCTIAGNLSTTGTATPITFRNTVTMNGNAPQAITSTLLPEFTNLAISNTGSTVTTAVNVNIAGNLSLSSGTLDLGEFTADRLTSGGTLTISSNTLLRIGGSNTLPANFATHSVGSTNTVDYSGANQVVASFNSSQKYGHLMISGTGAQTQTDVDVRNNLTVTGSFGINTNTIKVGGAMTNTGIFVVANGTVELNGSLAQSVPASVFTGNIIKGLTINNNAGVTLGGTLDLTDVLTVTNGSIEAGGYLTLKSSATATARIAPVTSVTANPIRGVVNAERYVPGRRKYRQITSPVTTAAGSVLAPGQEEFSIWGNWQNFGNNSSANAGNFITGGSSADGFDTQTSNASLFTYDDANRKYVGYTTANGKNTRYTPLKAGIAYYMFVYGDRRNTITASNPNPTVLTARGTVLTGDQVYNTTSNIPLTGVTGRWTMLGNPFASPVNWATIPKTNIANTYWGWDPNLSGTGGYVTVSTLGDVTITSPMSGVTGINQYIQSGQGFFVKTIGSNPSMTIREQDKVGSFNGNVFRTEGTPLTLIAANLQYTSGATKALADGVVAVFDDAFSNALGDEDATKMVNTTEGLAIANTAELLSIEGRRMPRVTDTIHLNISKLTRPQYTLQLFTKEMGALTVHPFLYDRYLDTLIPIITSDTTRIDFNVTPGVPASSDINRFKIVFRPITMLPVKFISVAAEKQAKKVKVQWKVAEESGISHYEIMRSPNGFQFDKVGEAPAKNTGLAQYEWLDQAPLEGNNFYRIRAVEANGQTFISNTVAVKFTESGTGVQVYPNPVIDRQIQLYINSPEKGMYAMILHDRNGRVMLQQDINHPGGRVRTTITGARLSSGLYYLTVTNNDNKYTEQILID